MENKKEEGQNDNINVIIVDYESILNDQKREELDQIIQKDIQFLINDYEKYIKQKEYYEFDAIPMSANLTSRKYNNRMITSKKFKDFKEQVLFGLDNCGKTIKKEEGNDLKLKIQVTLPNKRKRDVDNLIKPVQDVLKNVLFEDDSCIKKVTCEKLLSNKKQKTNLANYKIWITHC